MRRIFELYATGSWSLAQLSQELATLGVRTPAARLVSVETVRRMLLNPFYAGWVYWGEARYKGNHEPLVSQDTFEKVQGILRVRYRDCGEKGRLHFWLRGAAVCAECGARMTAEQHGRWSYYRCIRNVQSTRECRARFVNTDKAHLVVGQLLRRLRVPKELNVAIVKEAARIVGERDASLNRDRASLRVRHARLQEQEQRLTEGFAQGVVSLTAYKATVAKVQQQLAACDQALALTRSEPKRQLEKLSRILDVAASVWDYHGRLGGKAQTQLLRLVFKSITIDTTGVVTYALEVPFDSLLRDDDSERSKGGGSRSTDLEDTRLRDRPILTVSC